MQEGTKKIYIYFAPCVFTTHGSSFTKTNSRDAGVGATAQRGKLENDDLSDASPPALACLNDDTQPSDIAPCSHFSASSLVSHYDQSFAPCVFMTHGSSFTKTNGRDAGVGATEQRGKLENDDLSDTSCLLYTSPSPRDRQKSRMPSSA